MQLHLELSDHVQQLTALLQEADEDLSRIAAAVEDPANTAYLVFDERLCVGAVVMHWHPEESEILYIAMDKTQRGQGYGKACIAQLCDDARQRQVRSLIVGTASSSLDNLAFYQKCGFRMDAIRKDYFSYLSAPVYEDGILIRDMVLLRMEITTVNQA